MYLVSERRLEGQSSGVDPLPQGTISASKKSEKQLIIITIPTAYQDLVPYSGKFLRGRNFLDFRDQTPARENLFPRKFLPPKISC